jgi:hypothetical protein
MLSRCYATTARWSDTLGPLLDIKAVTGQRLSKHVAAATDMKTTIVQEQRNGVFYGSRHLSGNESSHNNRRIIFYVVRAEML